MNPPDLGLLGTVIIVPLDVDATDDAPADLYLPASTLTLGGLIESKKPFLKNFSTGAATDGVLSSVSSMIQLPSGVCCSTARRVLGSVRRASSSEYSMSFSMSSPPPCTSSAAM